jgi:CBS domain containing-hemolysin-like protein
MFEDLNWRFAARRAAVVIGIYLALIYVLSTVSPETFGLQSGQEILAVLVQAFFFFIIFTFVYAFVERSRNRRLAEMRKKSKEAKPAAEDSEAGSLKGRPNPNTSRKKARRRR